MLDASFTHYKHKDIELYVSMSVTILSRIHDTIDYTYIYEITRVCTNSEGKKYKMTRYETTYNHLIKTLIEAGCLEEITKEDMMKLEQIE